MKTSLYIFLFFLFAGNCLAQKDTIYKIGHCIVDNLEEKVPEPEFTKEEQPYVGVIDVIEMPEFPGGVAAMAKYISQNLQYPAMAREAGISGKVFLKFVVNEDGSISDIVVLKGVLGCPDCDKEAIRVVQSMPKWKPALNLNGKPVKSYFNLPFNICYR